ncbi:MAG: ABC transporter permease [Alphaproteobacteria bacterium]
MSGADRRNQDAADFEEMAAAVTGEIDEEEWQKPTPLERVQRTLHKYPALGPFLVLVAMVVVFSVVAPDRFLRPFNLSLIIAQVTVVGTLAIGQTIIILTAGVDLSVGAIAVFASIVMANLSAELGVPGFLALPLGFAFGTGCGLINGLLITRLKMPPFIVTLGTLSIFFALNLYVSGSATVRGINMDSILLLAGEPIEVFDTRFTLGSIGMLVMYGIMIYVLGYTAWGRRVYATGDDPESARLSGIRIDRVLLSVYALAGFIYAIGGWFLIGRVGAASPQSLQLANLESITAVVIGGTSLFGGRGGVLGTLFGAIIVGTAVNGLTIAGFDPLWQRFAIGVLVIVAVALDQWIRRVGK